MSYHIKIFAFISWVSVLQVNSDVNRAFSFIAMLPYAIFSSALVFSIIELLDQWPAMWAASIATAKSAKNAAIAGEQSKVVLPSGRNSGDYLLDRVASDEDLSKSPKRRFKRKKDPQSATTEHYYDYYNEGYATYFDQYAYNMEYNDYNIGYAYYY